MDPPPCVQNAMMTKDKKPFTYTPGGIDLSEVRSPRMQRRIERNANLGGAGDMPQTSQPPPQNYGPLPPSALAVMRPQTQVQVFPGPPPPPPMQKNIPPPPPPPTCPLPTQKVTTGDNQVLERPDMTKIIPENPMALLRKTGGPAPRKSLVEHMYEEQDRNLPSPPQRSFEPQSPRYQPPVVERPAQVSPPVQQQRQPQAYQPPPQQYHPQSPPQNQYQPSYQPAQPLQQQPQPVQAPQQQYQPPQGQQRSTDSPKVSGYQPPIIERQPTINRQEPQQKNISSNVGSLYIPPLNQQQQKVVSPPTPPERNQVQSPGAPNLKEAPRPWQQKNVQQQQELPPWAKKDSAESQSPPSAPNMQQRWQPQVSPVQAPQAPQKQPPSQQFSTRSPQVQQSPPAQNQSYPSNSFPVHIEIRTAPYQQEAEPSQRNPNAVYITQPVVLQHPGPTIEPPYKGQPRPQQQQQQQQQQPRQYQQPRQQVQQQPKVDASGARIIPIQVEGRTTPSTPGGERNLSRQLSWGNQPSQSNSFRVIQKITKTDDEDDDTPVTQHSARYPQEMPEQMRRMKINDNGHFRQVPQQNSAGRNVPVQAEGNGQPQPYVHPSEQVVPEPKKYMGSNIPSRSFKILQAMTAPSESSANANYNEEIPYSPVFSPYSYPYYPPPYWPEYYTNFYPPEQSEQPKNVDKNSSKSGRSTPLPSYAQPYWQDYYPNNYPQQQSDSTSKMSDRSSKSSTRSGGRTTPLPNAVPMPPPMPPPYWGYMPSPTPYGRPRSTTPKPESTLRPQTPKPNNDYQNQNVDESYQYPMYPPYFDPYYYSYYYGFPPMMPHYPYYQSSTENEEYSGYSSMDEMSNYNPNRRCSLKRRNSLENSTNSVQALRQHFEVRSKSAAPRITITPTYSQENIANVPPDKAKEESEDSDTEIENDKTSQGSNLCRLRSIKSVQNINVYANTEECLEDTDETSESEESSDEETDEDEMPVEHNGEEIIPHQLSVIYEESERGESRRSFRCSSVASECTTIAEHHSEEEEDEDFLATQNVKYKINLFQECSETSTTKSVGGRTIKVSEKDAESFVKFSYEDNMKTSHVSNHACVTERKTQVNSNISRKISKSLEDESEMLCIESKKDSFCNNIEDKEVLPEKPAEKEIVNEEAKQSDEDWWSVLQEEGNTNSSRADEDSITERENVCDNVNSKADTVMVNVGDEVVCVKLRNKGGSNRTNNVQERNPLNSESPKESDDSFFASVAQRNSVYDILKNDEEEEQEIVSGGTLMRVDSFASQLEAIKRNSGLWNLELGFNKPTNVIKEENFDSDMNDEKTCSTEHENVNNLDEKNSCQEEAADSSEDSEEIDFWSQIKNDDDDFTPRRRSHYLNGEDTEDCGEFSTQNIGTSERQCDNVEDTNDSTNSSNSSSSESHKKEDIELKNDFESNKTSHGEHYSNNLSRQEAEEKHNDDSEESSESESSEDEQEIQKVNTEEQRNRNSNSRSRSLEPQTIKERIEALRNSIAMKQRKLSEKEETTPSLKSKISAIEVPCESRSKTASTKSSIKSFEEYSEEEELDSGVISDISRHISDNEEFPELRKLTRYERAATHSRLFKLLQDECDIEEEEEDDEVFVKNEDKFSKLSVRQNRKENKLSQSRSKLSLPLNKCSEGIDEKTPQINKKLVEELVQSLLRSKKAQVFRNMPREKLYAAAVTILQEGIESGETPSEEFSSLLSPLRGDTESSTPAQTPQEFYADYNEYKQYYDSWSDATAEIMPSKAFKLLQEHLGANKLGTIEGILAKCPRILSSKNIPREILKLLDENGSDCFPAPSQNNPHSNDVTNT